MEHITTDFSPDKGDIQSTSFPGSTKFISTPLPLLLGKVFS